MSADRVAGIVVRRAWVPSVLPARRRAAAVLFLVSEVLKVVEKEANRDAVKDPQRSSPNLGRHASIVARSTRELWLHLGVGFFHSAS